VWDMPVAAEAARSLATAGVAAALSMFAPGGIEKPAG
jgi:hypothetical protein